MQNQKDSSSSDSVVDGCNQPDYDALEVPSKRPTEYSYAERRRDLLLQVRDLGHPSMINQTEAADRYGVSQQQISKDLDRLAEYVDARLGDRRELVTEAVFHRAIQGLLEEGEYRKAAQTVSDWNEWIDNHQELAELQERLAAVEQSQNRSDYQLK